MTSGPFHTDRQALAASRYHQQRQPSQTGVSITALNHADLDAALSGVELGTYDRQIVDWLAGWDPPTVAVVCGLLTRARDAGLPPADRRTILAALDQAADDKRDRAANCPDCADRSCGTCQYRHQTAQAYDDLAARLQHAREAAPAGPPTTPRGTSVEPGSQGDPAAGEAPQREAGG